MAHYWNENGLSLKYISEYFNGNSNENEGENG
jgi:hypothetical protein